jgi:hypothetical protein
MSWADCLGRRQVVLAEGYHAASLWTLHALHLLRDEAHLVANLELIKRAANDAVAMKIDFAAVGAHDKAAILLGKEPRDAPVIGHAVQFDLATAVARMILKLTARGVKSVTNGGMDVLVCMLRLRITPNYDFTPGNAQVDTDLIDVALLTRLPSFDDDAAGNDPVEEPLEGVDAFSDPLFNGGGRNHMTKRDLYGHLHRTYLLR